ncbi:MAG: NAD-dependent deacylase [Deltaproteobacteria bacterium]|nr:NAD-dependent deacylase [Kofleriaceae bacterium]
MSTTLPITDDTHVLVLTGAGISAESGVPTFRDAGGLWEGHDVHDVASPAGFARDPLLVWRFYSQRRANMEGVLPNDGHRALVALERRLGDRYLLVTQNVDGLHRAAGSERVIELHGELMRSRCTVCDRPPFEDRQAYKPGVAPMCGRCKAAGKDALLRPHIVWFGEMIDRAYLARIEAFVSVAGRRLVFLAVGTSGLVHPAAGLVDAARGVGGTSWLVNADRPANVERFDQVVLGPAGTVLPALLAN